MFPYGQKSYTNKVDKFTQFTLSYYMENQTTKKYAWTTWVIL